MILNKSMTIKTVNPTMETKGTSIMRSITIKKDKSAVMIIKGSKVYKVKAIFIKNRLKIIAILIKDTTTGMTTDTTTGMIMSTTIAMGINMKVCP